MAVHFSSHTLQGLTVLPVDLEVDVTRGMPIFSIIGMAGPSVQEAKDRVRSAIIHSGFEFPLTRKVVNLAPAEVKKYGSHYDLPMALGFLVASQQIPSLLKGVMVMGELGLDASVRPISGVLPAVLFARNQGVETVVLPRRNLAEARLVEGVRLVGVGHLNEAVEFMVEGILPPVDESEVDLLEEVGLERFVDFADISGHSAAKRALTVAAAGGHHVLMNGPPGSGKSLLAEAFPGLLPPLSREELLEVLQIHSIAGQSASRLSMQRPFRTVHPRITAYSLLGGGTTLSPGEVSLAHRGVLFMDEFPEFDRKILEGLRVPLESHELILKHGNRRSHFPCQFQLLAARNPCPCGFLGDPEKPCTCKAMDIARYQAKLSGPILDRMDIHVSVPRLAYEDFKLSALENSASLREKVMEARERQAQRLSPHGIFTNQEMSPKLLKQEKLDLKTEDVLKAASKAYALSGRAISRILKVSRTLADLEGKSHVEFSHLMEALQYRLGS